MALPVNDPQILALARELARHRGMTVTEAIISALEAELALEQASPPVSQRLLDIAADLKANAGPDGRAMSRTEIDALWGQ
jgi:antitoxin VapB